MLDQRRRRWADVVLLLYKCFVFTGVDDKDVKRNRLETPPVASGL